MSRSTITNLDINQQQLFVGPHPGVRGDRGMALPEELTMSISSYDKNSLNGGVGSVR